jgi:hypothetical protein
MESGTTRDAIQSAILQMRELIAREGNEREFDEAGYHCIILRDPDAGYLAGYVGLPRTHPLFGVDFSEVDETPAQISIHGGLEYSGPTVGPGRERPEHWYFGFDCDHFDDLSLKDLEAMDPVAVAVKHSSSYKTIEFVDTEVRNLARQFKASEHMRVYR